MLNFKSIFVFELRKINTRSGNVPRIPKPRITREHCIYSFLVNLWLILTKISSKKRKSPRERASNSKFWFEPQLSESANTKPANNKGRLESVSPTFYKPIWANILATIKSLTFTASIEKLCAKLWYKKAARKMLVKLTPVHLWKFSIKIMSIFTFIRDLHRNVYKFIILYLFFKLKSIYSLPDLYTKYILCGL